MNNNLDSLYVVRDYKQEDKSFIMATFLRGLYYGDSWFSLIPKDIFMDKYKVVIETLLVSPRVTIKVAVLPDDDNVILGYSIMSNDFQTVHWVFVKSVFRNKGIARSLLPKYPTAVSHLSKLGLTLLTKFQNVVFDPFRL